ncbi:MAG: hypothetical protein LBT66_04535 [Methanobrevibacter sp.]|jgi:hypothetical protein|nr:hypothetical protein [Candidatus Methanovirga meridionalis]
MIKKMFSLVLIALMLLSVVGFASAEYLTVDADWRLVTIFKVTDLNDDTTKTRTTIEVAAGDGHDIYLFDNQKFHKLSITVTYRGHPHPDFHQILINSWNGYSFHLYAGLKYNWHCYYESFIDWQYGGHEGTTGGSVVLYP